MRALFKIAVLAMITSFPISAYSGTYLDLARALAFKDHGQYGKAFPILVQLSEDGFVKAQMELANLYVAGHGVLKNNDKAVFWACQAAESGEIRALKFRIKLALKTTSETYQPPKCSEIITR